MRRGWSRSSPRPSRGHTSSLAATPSHARQAAGASWLIADSLRAALGRPGDFRERATHLARHGLALVLGHTDPQQVVPYGVRVNQERVLADAVCGIVSIIR